MIWTCVLMYTLRMFFSSRKQYEKRFQTILPPKNVDNVAIFILMFRIQYLYLFSFVRVFNDLFFFFQFFCVGNDIFSCTGIDRIYCSTFRKSVYAFQTSWNTFKYILTSTRSYKQSKEREREKRGRNFDWKYAGNACRECNSFKQRVRENT